MKIIGSIIALVLTALSFSTYANKIVIVGEPITIEKQGDVYHLPKGYDVSNRSYYYVTVDGSQRVCYAEKQPALVSLEPTPVVVSVNDTTVTWNCYPMDQVYFEVAPR